jgi:hypothetical protein
MITVAVCILAALAPDLVLPLLLALPWPAGTPDE